jgi:hypothetical protein
MFKRGLTALLVLLLLGAAALAQTSTLGTTRQGTQSQSNGNPVAPTQSLAPTPDVCSAGSQSIRVCNNDFQSCSSVCNGLTLTDPNADVAGCSLRCCSIFNACLSIRGCATGTVNCF